MEIVEEACAPCNDLEVTPDRAAEAEAILSGFDVNSRTNVSQYARPVKYGGIYAFGFRSGQQITPADAAKGSHPVTVALEYDTGDLLFSDYAGGYGCDELWIASATVAGIYSMTHVGTDESTTFDLQVAIGDADGSVTYSAEDSTSSVVASGTATNAAGSGHYTATFTTPVSATTLAISWSGTWSAISRTFTTRAIVR